MHKSLSRFFVLALVAMALMILASGPVLADAEMTDATGLSGYEVVVSPTLNFSDTGYGGWSCPTGKVVLGGGFVGSHAVAVSAPGTPGSVWPHYTFGANEYGWVVQSAPDGQSDNIKIYAICADAPAGYQVVTSSQFNFNSSGWAGWSCPAGKVVLGGGFKMPVAAAASAPGTPGSVWPHYTFPAGEYGWVAQAAGAGPGFVYPICADAPDGYEVVKSGVLNFGDGGWAGWSLVNGKVVSGGGFQMGNGPVAAQAPGTPGSVWPHYTFGNEYGWVVRDNPDGNSNPGSHIYVIYANLLPPPSVSPVSEDPLVCDEGTVNIVIDDVADLYGYEFIVEYDDSLVDAEGEFVDDWFDEFDNGIEGAGYEAVCSGGECKFGQTRSLPDANELATTDPQVIASIDFEADAPLATPTFFDVTVKDVKLTDKDSFVIPGAIGGTLSVQVCGTATVSGQINLQGRPQPLQTTISGPPSVFEVSLTGPYGTFSDFASDTDGSYSIDVPYTSGGTLYDIEADHSVYLPAADIGFTVSADLSGKSTTLLGGDATGNDAVGLGDITCINGFFGSTTPAFGTCGPVGGPGTPDVNDDGIVNIQDLALAAGNYEITTTGGSPNPQPW